MSISKTFNEQLLRQNPFVKKLQTQIGEIDTSGLYYKPMTIVKDDSMVVTKLITSLTDNARVIIYDRHMFIVQATGRKVFYNLDT